MIQRANDSIKNAQVRLLPDAGHPLAMTHSDICLAALRAVAADAAGPGR